ncbi:MAG: response regulator transcription factor [Lachnospiraceae bacterium]|nr:response regulator transcription factor [Lachnospiraceae bacterium]
MKTVLIVEDNARSMEMLTKVVKDIRTDVVILSASRREEAEILALNNKVDLFMVDIVLDTSNPGDVSGMKFAERIRAFQQYKYAPIIFITSLEDPKLYAYSDIHCYYYVEKPFDAEKISSVIAEALEFPRREQEEPYIFFRIDGVLYKKYISEIVYIENSRAGQIIYCTSGNLELPYKSMKTILKELDSERFIQCSRFTIINQDYIEKIDIVNRYIQLKDVEKEIELGNSFKKNFLKDVVDDK